MTKSNMLAGIAERSKIVQVRTKKSRVATDFQSEHGMLYFTVNLGIPPKSGAYSNHSLKERRELDLIVTSKGLVQIENLPDNAMIGFDVSIEFIASTGFSHELLQWSNEMPTKVNIVTNWTIYANAKSIDLRGLDKILDIDQKRLQGYLASKFKSIIQRAKTDKEAYEQWHIDRDTGLPYYSIVLKEPATAVEPPTGSIKTKAK